MMPPMTPPTIAPVLFLEEFGVCVLATDILLEGSEVVGEEDNVPDGLMLVVSPFERKTPFFLLQQVCAAVPFPQQ